MRQSAVSDDLGLGKRVAEQTLGPLLNPDGSFNVVRRGLPFWHSLHLYSTFTRMSWGRFYLVVAAGYLAVNLLFGAAFYLAGPDAVAGLGEPHAAGRFLECFFFSVQTLSTIGYGAYAPVGTLANLLVTAEALTGMFFVALATGMIFARFARPRAKFLFSKRAVIAPFQGGRAFMFRVANALHSQLLDLNATVIMSRLDPTLGAGRRFLTLTLERESVMFLPLHWVVVHPITPDSPLWEMDERAAAESGAEFLILLRGMDESTSQPVYARASYGADRVVWDAKFDEMYDPPRDGAVSVDLRKLSSISRV